ncbi:protein diaphanous homolog 3 isoform X2 [Hypomesus transpacificus]|uniref:protein diaphanous homolog 3 isoform X2 n=1 Tax=Hypomesus transpacificus TaxID=137520 RepID=UPI001F08799A|nr:protein diaphanous homolog 3 isoform X2 [Hypomesus transpacificus]
MENSYQQRFDSSGRDGKLRKKGFTGALGASSQGTSSFEEGERKPKFLDRFASIRIPGSKKDRPPLPHLKPSSSCDWSSSSSSAEFEELSSKITSEKEILALFEKMMEDMNLNEDKRAPLRQKDLSTKREMVLQYVVTASKADDEVLGRRGRSRGVLPGFVAGFRRRLNTVFCFNGCSWCHGILPVPAPRLWSGVVPCGRRGDGLSSLSCHT